MTQEEKAKAYDEALERARKSLRAASDIGTDIVTFIFPQLAESEDEMIIRNLIDAFIEYKKSGGVDFHGIKINTLLDWLEKQKEQKPALTPERIHPKFAVGDTVCRPMWSDHTIREIYVRCNDPVYVCVNDEGTESHISFSEQDEWERKEQKPINESNMHEPTLDEARKWNEAYEKGYSLGYENGRNEQKPVEWGRQSIIDALTKWLTEKIAPLHKKSLDGTITEREEMFEAALLEMRSLVNSPDFKIGKDTSIEWSEKDRDNMNHIRCILDDCYCFGRHDLNKADRDKLMALINSLDPENNK